MKLPGVILAFVLSTYLLVLSCSRPNREGASPAPQNSLSDSRVEATEPGLFMAGTEMRLGMAEESLVAKLKENYTLTDTGEHGWTIWEREPRNEMVGAIGFTEGKLSWISKDWGYYEDAEARGVGKELFSLLSSLTDKKPTPILVDAKVAVRQPGLVINEIQLIYPKRTISISIWESKDKGNGMALREVLKAK